MFQFFLDMVRRWRSFQRDEWAHVPPPNYRCSRGKQTNCKYGDYW